MAYKHQFHWADYLVFGLSLGLGLFVGLFFAIKERWHKQSAESYLMANRNMNWILVGFSFWATVVSANFLVGMQTDFYYYGMTAVWMTLARFIGGAFVIIFVIPKFYRLGFRITSAYEYFEHRFNMVVRMAVGVLYVILTLLYMAVSLYIPGLVLEAVSELNIYASMAVGAVVCIAYTSMGGMKAVIWVDSLQIIIMVIGIILLAAKGVASAGGMSAVWHYYTEIGQRDNWDDLNPDPWNRHSLWNTLFLHAFTYAGMFGVNQSVLQRYMTVNDMRYAQWSVMLGIVLGVGFSAMVLICAMAAFATVGGNEPMLNIPGQKRDQILPYFLMYLLGDYNGIPGLVVASLFAAALSTISSGQNALAAIISKDFIQPIYRLTTHRELKPRSIGWISKVTAVVVGILTLVICLAVPLFNDTLLSVVLSVLSFINGPLLGIMIGALFCFWIEQWGALVGLICSLGWALMMYFGAMFRSNRLGREPQPWFNNNFTDLKTFQDPDVTPGLFDVSYTWYGFLDVMVFLIVATVVSLIVHCVKHKGRLSLKNIMPPKDLRYTLEDFKIAVSCRSTVKQDDYSPSHLANGVDKKQDLVMTDEETIGSDNPAFDNTHL